MEESQAPRPAFDPDIPEPMARLLSEHPDLLRKIRDGWRPHPFWPARIPQLARAAAILLAVVSLLILAVTAGVGDGLNPGDVASALAFGLTFSGGFFGIAAAVELLPNLSQLKVNQALRYAAEHPDGFVLATDLDERTRPLLRRAQDATDAVLSSEIGKRGMLDGTLNAVRLREETWQLARRLAELSRIAADYTAIVGDDVPDEFAEAFRPYDETLRTGFAALTAKVEALEDYAEKVRRADRHFEVYRNMERLREHHPRFERLRAELAADEVVGSGPEELGTEVEQVEQRLRDSIAEARQAADYLLDAARPPGPLPPPAPPPSPRAPAQPASASPDAGDAPTANTADGAGSTGADPEGPEDPSPRR